MTTTIIEVSKNQNENNMSLLRRFTRRVQESGSIRRVKSLRYNERPPSKLSLKKRAMNKIKRRIEVEHLKKMGKMA
jgi:ribosomal protein S21